MLVIHTQSCIEFGRLGGACFMSVLSYVCVLAEVDAGRRGFWWWL